VAEGGATYTVNIELDSKQFSQDLRTLKNKIKDDLGKAVKVGTNQGTTRQQVAQQIRRQREEDQAARKRFYNADKINAFRVRQGKATADNNKLLKIGLDVEERQKDIGAAMKAAEKGRFQWAEAKLKVANEQIAKDFKDLDLINKKVEAEKKLVDETNKKAAAEKKVQDRAKKVADAKKKEADARKAERVANKAEARENRQRKGPQGIRMHGPVDVYGNPIYQKGPTVPKSGASLPIDLGRKDTGTFAKAQERLLRRRNTLTALLESFKGAGGNEAKIMEKNLKALEKQYEKITNLRIDMKSRGSDALKRSGYWGEMKDGKLVTKDHIGKAGTITRELEQLDSATHLEEARGKQLKIRIKAEKDFLNDKHRIEKLLARFDAKGVSTTAKRLKLEKAVTAQDQSQLTNLLKETEIEQARLSGRNVSGATSGGGGRGRGGRRSTWTGGPSSPLNIASNGQILPGPRPSAWGRMGQSALISGGFPLLFGQNPAIAALGAAGGALGEAITPGGGFAGGIAATAIGTTIGSAITSIKNLSNSINPLKFNADKAVEALGFLNSERAREIKLIEKTKGANAALLEVQKELQNRYGAGGVVALNELSSGMGNFMKDFKVNITDIKVEFAEMVKGLRDEKGYFTDKGLDALGKDSDLAQQYRSFRQTINSITSYDSESLKRGTHTLGSGSLGVPSLTALGREQRDQAKIGMKALEPSIIKAGIDANTSKIVSEINNKYKEQTEIQLSNFATERRILELRREGLNPALAKSMVTIEKMSNSSVALAEQTLESYNMELQKNRENKTLTDEELQIAIDHVASLRNKVEALKDGNDKRKRAVILSMEGNMQVERQLALWKDIGSTIKSGLVEVLNDALDTTKSIDDAMNKLMNTVSNKLLDYGISSLLANSGLPGAKTFFGFANGGRPPKGRPSIVGERGPELFVPDSSGTIIPNHELGSGSNVVVNVDATGTAVEGNSGQAEQLGSMLAEAVQAELVKQQRPGGILARSR